MKKQYDIIVVGGGHAGCEAAAAAANLGANTLLITMDMTKFAQMSCNPAMGGVAKGQIVREIDALGGYSGLVSDASAIQFRMLNRSKGPAMWSPRTQNDRTLFTIKWRDLLENTPNLHLWQDAVTSLDIHDGQIRGIHTSLGIDFNASAVILTAGTFMNGLIHVGEKQIGGGRMGEKASFGLTEQLIEAGFETGRMKTGTPARIDGRSLDYSVMETQHGDPEPRAFSFLGPTHLKHQRPCFITYTNPTVHDIISQSIDSSPLFNGQIDSIGPRYCPSIEDKVFRFASKDRHQLFVEPEGWKTHEVYVNGFSSSLPLEIQEQAIQKVKGFENAVLHRPGYAIEYDYFIPTQLKHSLETMPISGLFFAGQINGTTGYEEAAAQGLIAGINAYQKIKDKSPLVLKRSEAYIGVLIDDLITKGTDEPYRMFTSRAEYRITLRQDTADERLTPVSHEIGLASSERMRNLESKLKQRALTIKALAKTSIKPEEVNPQLDAIKSSSLTQSVKAESLLTRPNITIDLLRASSKSLSEFATSNNISNEALESAEIITKYAGYIGREREMAEKLLSLDKIKVPVNFDYHGQQSLSMEAREKLSKQMPENLGQASRISGIRPADISVLMVALNQHVSHETQE